MVQTAKIIKIHISVGGSGGSSGGASKSGSQGASKSGAGKQAETQSYVSKYLKRKLAAAGVITAISGLVSTGINIAETLSYNSVEKDSMLALGLAKNAVTGILGTAGLALGGPAGAAVAMVVNKAVVEPTFNYGALSIKRGLDQTRATNRFYLTDFATKGNQVFDYTTQSYISEDVNKTTNSKLWKRSYR